jgi:hypothetical protein
MIEFVKFKDVTDSINACNHCHYGCNGTRDANNCGHWHDCAGGYFLNKPPTQQRTRPRKSRDRRLLKALVRSVNIYQDGMVTWKPKQLTPREASEIIAIKQTMEKKGGK